jgi:DNA repair protein RecO (recombination protein O)
LERLSQVRLAYYQRETRELVNLDSCELIRSQFDLVSDYTAGVALDYIAEICEHLLPPEESNEKFFRLVAAVLDSLHQGRDQRESATDGRDSALSRQGAVWRGLTYFSLWAVRLSGWLPALDACLACGSVLEHTDRAFFSRMRTGLICEHCRRASAGGGSWELAAQSRALAAVMLLLAGAAAARAGSGGTAADLRRFLVQQIETHAERRLITARMMEATPLEEAPPRPESPRRAAAF